MADVYTPVPTQVEGSAWTARKNNKYLRDNWKKLPPDIFTAKGDLSVATGAAAIDRLGIGTAGQDLVSDNTQAKGRKWASSGRVPVGGIVIWSGSIVSIPANWHLCDGSGGTPDLRGRFIIGSGLSYATGDNGGAAALNLQHSHTSTSPTDAKTHTHPQGSTDSGGAHQHTYDSDPEDLFAPSSSLYGTYTGAQSVTSDTHTHTLSGTTSTDGAHVHTKPANTNSGGSHSHTVAAIGTDNQLSAAQSVMPPYYALAFIQRIA